MTAQQIIQHAGLATLFQRPLVETYTATRRSSTVSLRVASGARYLSEASDYAADVIECTADICTYI
jgi:hypothetical protein